MPTSQRYRLTRPMAMVNLSYPKIRSSLSRWKKSRCAGKWGSDTGAEGGRVYCWRISWSNIIQEGSSWVGFLVEAVYDLLSSPANVLLSSVLWQRTLRISPQALPKGHWCRDHMLKAGAESLATATKSSKCHHLIIIPQKMYCISKRTINQSP